MATYLILRRNLTAFIATTLFVCSAGSVRALSSPNIAPVAAQYTSAASPRFDVFSEKLVGEWRWKTGDDDDALVMESVQEVMRSCGGAVQGIRELPSISPDSDKDEGGYYLNRANDGFLYFDRDGSYSCGPVKVSEASSSDPWISSLSFGKSRLLIRKDDINDKAFERMQVLKKPAFEPVTAPDETNLESLPGDIVWEEIVRCRMPSPTQPWMMQRLKWEKCCLYEVEEVEEREDPRAINGWACEATDEPAIKGIMGDISNSVVWSAGGICPSSGTVKSILRQYSSSSGSLQSVAWLQGRTHQKNDADPEAA